VSFSQHIGSSQLDLMVFGGWMTIIFSRFCLVLRNYEVREIWLLLRFAVLDICLLGHKYIRPKAIHDAEVVDEYSKNYIYFACIQFINSASICPIIQPCRLLLKQRKRIDQNCLFAMAFTNAG
jgi:Phosphotyrosyl phosphate activator (PTPA) protein